MREDTGVTQVELASRLGVTQSRVAKVELGERRVDIIELRAWCLALGISLERFVGRLERSIAGKPLS
jgi:transcriptional regulator with XRE-family HTH domain